MIDIKENIHCFQYMFFFFFLIFSMIYLSILNKYLPPEDDRDFLIKAMDYWKKKPIWKIVALNNDDEDPEDMEKYPIGIWNGLVEGCNCTQDYRDYLKGSCSKEELNNRCTNIKEVEPKKIYNYFFKYSVTYYDYDYLTLLNRVDKNNYICKKGFKQCGFLDNMLHPFCVKEDENCVANVFFFSKFKIENTEYINIRFGFSEDVINTNFTINNLFLKDNEGCILNEDYLTDDFMLFKFKKNSIGKCDTKKSRSIYTKIPGSYMTKSELYFYNKIYNGDGVYPNMDDIRSKYNNNIYLYAMTYYGLNDTLNEYTYSDAFIYKHLKLLNILIFIIFKVGIQFGYFMFIQKSRGTKVRILIYNIIWLVVFMLYLIFIVMFNNSLCRTAQLASFDAEDGDAYYKVMKKLKISEIIFATFIITVHILKSVSILTDKGKKKYSEFINQDK